MNNNICIYDIEILFSELDYYEELKKINLEKNLNDYEKSFVDIIIKKIKETDFSKIMISKVKFFYDFGFYHNGYAEFLYVEDQLADCLKNPIREFEFDNYNIKIGEASNKFKMIFNEMTTDKYFEDWEYHKTIKVKGVNENNFERVIQMALFFINKYSPSQKGRVVQMFSYYNIPKLEEVNAIPKINKVLYEEPLIFYEKALQLGYTEISYIYLYKVLEYFFFMNRKDECIQLIDNYNNSNDSDKIDIFMREINKFPQNKEEESLRKLLENSNYNSQILSIISSSSTIKIADVNDLAKKLYFLRNNIVHGKLEYKLDLSLPELIIDNKMAEWINIIKSISELIINNFCFEHK
ncbi:MAG: hypothetical protein ACRC5T_00630 [Cetobacterium sp.]